MKEELVEGIKNAIEHGYSLQAAVDSFVNAGYNPAEVQEAARAVSGGVSSFTPPASPASSPKNILPSKPLPAPDPKSPASISSPPQAQSFPSPIQKKKSGARTAIIILLIVVLFFLLGILGILIYMGDEIVARLL